MVKWTQSSRIDLKKIYDYISNESKLYARKVISSIIIKAENFNTFPQMGRVVPELMNQSVREIIVYSYRIVYQVTFDNVDILAVIHAKRDFGDSFQNSAE